MSNAFERSRHLTTLIISFLSACFVLEKMVRALVVHKLTRLDALARTLGLDVGSPRLVSELSRKGYPIDILKGSHERHYRVLSSLTDALVNANATFTRIDARSLKRSHVRGKDVVFSIGGDGTVLKTASKIFSNQIPFIGINSDPVLSAGQLCAIAVGPDDNSDVLSSVVERFQTGRFREVHRSRIRASLHSDDENIDMCATHHENVSSPALFALNECFLSENDPSRPTLIEMMTHKEPKVLRSSGIIVSTATGSTGWLKNAGAIHPTVASASSKRRGDARRSQIDTTKNSIVQCARRTRADTLCGASSRGKKCRF